MEISENKLVTLDYKLFVKNEDGTMELMEETTADNPLVYIHGIGMMMPKFEELIAGNKLGDSFEFTILADDAYGQYSDDNVVDLPKTIFMQNGELNRERIFVGAIVPLVNASGDRISAEIVEIKDNEVRVDLNHPLAGEDLFFTGKVLDVHIPTESELSAMQGGGCGCGGGSCSSEGCGCGCGGCC